MKSLIEAAIAILIVYLFFEWQKEKTAAATSSTSATTSTAPAPVSAPSSCGCGGSAQKNYTSPDMALPVSAPVGEHVLAGVFRTTQAVASAAIPTVVPTPVAAGPAMRPRILYSVSAA